jgi:hypothetical protein
MHKPGEVIVGVYGDPEVILHAAEQATSRGWKGMDMITPYPLHGSEKALGLRQSWVPWVTLIAGLAGGLGGLALEGWTAAVDWPINVGGKSYFSWPAYIPITFESGILVGGIATFIAMLVASRLPKKKPLILDERLTNDKFGLIVPILDGMKSEDIVEFLRGSGAEEVRTVEA